MLNNDSILSLLRERLGVFVRLPAFVDSLPDIRALKQLAS
jgi:hypothetical protein